MGKQRGRRLLKKQDKENFHPSSDNIYYDDLEDHNQKSELHVLPNTFFGVLDTQELEYFKETESTLSIDPFETIEEKHNFITNVIEESKGKELKLATSQICSKLMERLILESNDLQLKSIFKAFNGFFFNVSCHKYSSHVLETLLVRGAALVEKELLTSHFENDMCISDNEILPSMENMFLFMLNELKPNLEIMLNHQYASHVLRLLMLILSSKTLPNTTQNNSTLRSKRSKIARKMIEIKDNEDFNKVYKTPDSFKIELKEILSLLYKYFTNGVSIGLKDCSNISLTSITKAREMCIDKIASPVLQLIIQIEGIFDRNRSYWNLIFSNSEGKDPKEESFMEYLLSDTVGSHFLQNAIKFTRKKYAERLYRLYIKDRVLKLAKRDNTGAFVIQSLLQSLCQNEAKHILNALIPELSILLNSNINFGVEMINTSNKYADYMKEQIIEELLKKYYSDSPNKNILESCLHLESSTLGNTRDDWPTADERRNSLFLEKLIDYDDRFLNITIESLLALPQERFLQMCYHGVFSHVVEHVLQVKRVEIIKRKLLLNVLCNDIVNLSCNAYGSHIVDKLWVFTAKLALYKDRIATNLTDNSVKIKNSTYGRHIWSNWSLELFLRKRLDWKKKIRQQELELFPDSKPLQPPVKSFCKRNDLRQDDRQLPPKKRKFTAGD